MVKDLKSIIRNIPDFPKPGIVFRDITTLLLDSDGFHQAVSQLAELYKNEEVDLVAGIESRGFILGGAMAYVLGVGFIPLRKPGKLPGKVYRVTYSLEYGTDSIEMHVDAVKPGQHVLVVDDLLATGGTAKAAIELIEKCKGIVQGPAFLVELSFLGGREKLKGYNVRSLVKYESE